MGWVYSKNGYYITKAIRIIQVSCCWDSKVWNVRIHWVCSKNGYSITKAVEFVVVERVKCRMWGWTGYVERMVIT
jgi:hypothetical protein